MNKSEFIVRSVNADKVEANAGKCWSIAATNGDNPCRYVVLVRRHPEAPWASISWDVERANAALLCDELQWKLIRLTSTTTNEVSERALIDVVLGCISFASGPSHSVLVAVGVSSRIVAAGIGMVFFASASRSASRKPVEVFGPTGFLVGDSYVLTAALCAERPELASAEKFHTGECVLEDCSEIIMRIGEHFSVSLAL